METISRRTFGATTAVAVVGASLAGTCDGKSAEQKLAQRIRSTREGQGKSVADCCDESGLSECQWQSLEDGTEQGAIELAYAALALGVTVEWLVYGDAA